MKTNDNGTVLRKVTILVRGQDENGLQLENCNLDKNQLQHGDSNNASTCTQSKFKNTAKIVN